MKFVDVWRNKSLPQITLLWATHIFDAVITAQGLYSKSIVELNPLLASMWDVHPISFFITKFSLLMLATGIAIHHWRDRRMRYAIYTINLGMLVLCMYELLRVIQ